MTDIIRAVEARARLLSQEHQLTGKIHAGIQQCINVGLSPVEQGRGWAQALNAGTDKRFAAQQVNTSLFPRPVGQPALFAYTRRDSEWLKNISPPLEQVMQTGEVYSHAAYAIGEYFIRTGNHNLSSDQVIAVAHLFPPRHNESPEEYNARVNAMPLANHVPRKSNEETWTMRREILDVLEIESQLERKYVLPAYGRTIHISDFTIAAANTLRMVHLAATPEGVDAIHQQDRQIVDDYLNIRRISSPHMLSLDLKRLLNKGVSEEDILITADWVARDPQMQSALNSFVAYLKMDKYTLLKSIALAEREQRGVIEKWYKDASLVSDGTAQHGLDTGLWTAQSNNEGMNTCLFAAGVNALRSLGLDQYTEQSLLDPLGGDSFARANAGQGATSEEIITALRKQHAPISITQSTSLSEILRAVSYENAAAIVPLGIGHVGTLPKGSKVFRENGMLKIPMVDTVGPAIINQEITNLLQSDITFARAIKEPRYSSGIIIRRRS